jgi:hypothetical protein
VTDNFSDNKDQFLFRLTIGTEQSLLRAGVLNTTEIPVMQAFLIYLEFAGQTYGTRAICNMAGLLIRTAVSMGIHRDGSHFSNLSHFDTEMSRRLWWHICFLDSRVAEVPEHSISESMFDTQEPTNLDDVDVDSGMLYKPVSREGYTDLSLCLLRCELWRLGCETQSSISSPHPGKHSASQILDQRLQILKNSRETIGEKYLRYLEQEKPIHSFIETIACLALTRCELVIRHTDIFREATNSWNNEQGHKSFLTAIESLEYTHALETQAQMRQWGWIFHGCVQWHAIGVVLVQLCMRSWGPTCERAWTVVRRAFGDMPEATRKKSLHHPVHGLMAAVRRHRRDEIQRLRTQPAAAQQLSELARLHPPMLKSLEAPAGRTAFEISAAEERLSLETAVLAGIDRQSLCSSDLRLAGDTDLALDWVDWTDSGSTPFVVGDSTCLPEFATHTGEVTMMTGLTSQIGQAPINSESTTWCGAGSVLNAGSGNGIPALFSSRVARNRAYEVTASDDEMSWLVRDEVFESADVPQ